MENKTIIQHILDKADSIQFEKFMEIFYQELNSDTDPFEKKGRNILQDIINGKTEDLFLDLCGWSIISLLKKARLIPDDDGTFYPKIEDAEFVSIWDNGSEEIVTKCKVNMSTFEVFNIEAANGDDYGVTTLDGEYIRFNEDPDQQYPVYEKTNADEPIVNFWYKLGT